MRILPFKQLTRHKSLATVALTCPLWHFWGFCLLWCWWWVDFETDNTQMVRSCLCNFSKKKNFTILEKWPLKEVYEPLHHASESLWLKKVPALIEVFAYFILKFAARCWWWFRGKVKGVIEIMKIYLGTLWPTVLCICEPEIFCYNALW